jgi:hypothetical protein
MITYEQEVSQQQNMSQLKGWMSQPQVPTSVLYELINVSDPVKSMDILYERLIDGLIKAEKMMKKKRAKVGSRLLRRLRLCMYEFEFK